MKLIFKQTLRFIVAEKPYGLTTHKVDDFKDGFKEFLEQKTGLDLAIVSRLDATTSGLILFPLKHYAAEINALWQTDSCVKTYLFVTDKPFRDLTTAIEVHSFIEQKGSEKIWTSDRHKTPNAVSEFKHLKTIETSSGRRFIWQAKIKTGKTHQIRLHAKDLGISILGDTKYGGSVYFRLCLHCTEIQISGEVFTSPSPFERLTEDYFPLISEFEQRSRLYSLEPNECFRWLHEKVCNGLLDQYGSELFFYVYFGSAAPSAHGFPIESLEKAKDLTLWISSFFNRSVFLKPMYDRGKTPSKNELHYFDAVKKIWINEFTDHNWSAHETDLKFQLKSHQGQSPGLFLDQRENRKWVQNNSENKAVLNLFSYTGGFSVAAAKGKASEVTTVDLSRNFIEWSKENFLLNNLALTEKFQFWSADTLHFLKGAQNKKRTWDLIICDPPTFGRSDKGTFQIEKDFESLIHACYQSLNPGGHILFSTNFEKWNQEDLYMRLHKALTGKKLKFSLEKTPYQSLDFDFPNQNGKMKSLFIRKTH